MHCRYRYTQRCSRVPVGLCVPRARVPRFFCRLLRSRAPVRNCFCVPPRSRVPVLRSYASAVHANLAFLLFRVPRSCIKFAFPRTCVPKMPGAREREARNARPSLGIPLRSKLGMRMNHLFCCCSLGYVPPVECVCVYPRYNGCTVGTGGIPLRSKLGMRMTHLFYCCSLGSPVECVCVP